MEAEIFLGLLLRLLPAIVVIVLAFVAMNDKKTRDQWNNLLYQIGSIKPAQREDEKIGRSLKWPFFLVAAGLLLWPIQYYRHATRTIDASASDLRTAKPQSDLSRNAPADNSVSGSNSVTDGNSATGSTDNGPAPRSDLSAPPASPANPAAPQSDLSQADR